MAADTGRLVAEILNAAWMVRHYSRNQIRRRQAIQRMGLAVREAFNKSDKYEILLSALLDGLRPKDEQPF